MDDKNLLKIIVIGAIGKANQDISAEFKWHVKDKNLWVPLQHLMTGEHIIVDIDVKRIRNVIGFGEADGAAKYSLEITTKIKDNSYFIDTFKRQCRPIARDNAPRISFDPPTWHDSIFTKFVFSAVRDYPTTFELPEWRGFNEGLISSPKFHVTVINGTTIQISVVSSRDSSTDSPRDIRVLLGARQVKG